MYLCAVCGYKYMYFLLQRNCRVATTSCCCCNLLLLMTARSNKKRGEKKEKKEKTFLKNTNGVGRNVPGGKADAALRLFYLHLFALI